MVGHGGSSAGSYLADPTSPIPSHCASSVVTSTLRSNECDVSPECSHKPGQQSANLHIALLLCTSAILPLTHVLFFFLFTAGQMMWPLDECDSHQCVLRNLDNKMEYIAGSTNTSGGMYVTWNVSIYVLYCR